ncbi:MAG: IS200/IS605 family element transposase accessory protein TnpB [Nitrososphaerales archaeon]|nr:IS200/IS605 family element transposase accessory protein TnpB [Nitrososphaerales archaeon]
MLQTLMVRLETNDEEKAVILKTLEQFNLACNYAAPKGVYTSKYELQKAVYRELREKFGLGAQMVIRVISKVVEVYKRDKTAKPEFRSRGAIQYDRRNLSWKGLDRVSISTIKGRMTLKTRIGEYQKQHLCGKVVRGQVDLIYRNGLFHLAVVVDAPEETLYEAKNVLGVDLGIENLATDSTGEHFSGSKVDEVRKRYTSLRARLQARGTKSAKRHLKKLSGRERRFKRNVNHIISKALVGKAKRTESLIALEDLKGIRERVRVGHNQRERHNKWAFRQLRNFIEYKAKMAGVPLQVVDPRNTSRTCPRCGTINGRNRPERNRFRCVRCSFSEEADYVAALNIAKRAAFNQPIVAPSLNKVYEVAAISLPLGGRS